MRAQSEIEIRILDMIEPEAKAMGLDVVRVRLTGSRPPTLQIMAEKPDGSMDVADCAKLSRRLSPLLDTEDPIVGEYSLEVSSPGIDRPLTRNGDFAKWVGHEVRVEIGVPIDGRKRFHGFIAGEKNGVAELKLKDGGTASVPIDEMVKAHLVLTDALIKATQAKGQAPAALEEDEIANNLGGDFDDVEVEGEEFEEGLDAEAAGPGSDDKE